MQLSCTTNLFLFIQFFVENFKNELLNCFLTISRRIITRTQSGTRITPLTLTMSLSLILFDSEFWNQTSTLLSSMTTITYLRGI